MNSFDGKSNMLQLCFVFHVSSIFKVHLFMWKVLKSHSQFKDELCMVLDILDIYTWARAIIALVIHQNSIVKTNPHHGQHCWGMESSDHIKSLTHDSSCTHFVCLFPLPYHMSLPSHKVKKSTKAIPHLANTWKSSSFRQAPVPNFL